MNTFDATRQRALALTVAAITTLAPACGSPTSPQGDFDLSDAIALDGGGSLLFEGAASQSPYRTKIEQVVGATVTTVRGLLPIDGVTIIARAGTATVIPEIGMGGRADAGTVQLAFDLASPVLSTSLDTELFPLLAHELHHTARMRTIGYGNDLLGAMISEGLADQFAVEVAGGEPPIWATALSGEQLATWSGEARKQWFDGGYDHDAWFFGVGGRVPRWAGYSIGFAMTGEFLVAHPSRRPSTLFAEPATSFVDSH